MFSLRFSANVLMSLCHRIDAQPLAGMIVIGDGQAARAVALAGNSMKIPVLWAKGGTANLKDGNREVGHRNQEDLISLVLLTFVQCNCEVISGMVNHILSDFNISSLYAVLAVPYYNERCT